MGNSSPLRHLQIRYLGQMNLKLNFETIYDQMKRISKRPTYNLTLRLSLIYIHIVVCATGIFIYIFILTNVVRLFQQSQKSVNEFRSNLGKQVFSYLQDNPDFY